MRLNGILTLCCTLIISFATAENMLHEAPCVKFAMQELAQQSSTFEVKLSLDSSLGEQSYRITPLGKRSVAVAGGDESGVMYGVLDVAEQVSFGVKADKIEPKELHPYILKRGMKMNVPLDSRTPSYDDTGDAAQSNIEVMWEWEYWQELLDDMARNRYNLLTLWSLNPFPSMVKVPEYPDVALDDVCRYTGEITDTSSMRWLDSSNQKAENQEVIKKISIDEKIEFWSRVFNYATDRGIEVHIYTWNIFTCNAAGKHGITWDQNNPTTADYFRKSVKAFLLTYPMIKGIGVTAGEFADRKITGRYGTESWMWETYGQGIMDAKFVNQDIDVRFIFRQHWSDWSIISDAFRYFDGVLESSFKYSRARMFSSTTPPWFEKIFQKSVEENGIKCWFNLRNDDIFTFRWGNPEYANRYFQNMPRELSPGYFVGSDGYIWGRTFNSKDPQCQGVYEFRKQWYSFMIWGRAGYDPTLTRDFYTRKISEQFPKVDAKLMYETWSATSDVIEYVDKLHFRQNDEMFAPEACMGKYFVNKVKASRFISIDRLLEIGSMPEQGVISISDYANGVTGDCHITPFDIADQLDAAAKRLLTGYGKLQGGDDAELRETLNDFSAMGHLADYYAAKFRAATHLAIYRVKGDQSDKSAAIKYAQIAIEAWDRYADAANRAYYPHLLARVSHMDWDKIREFVVQDLEIAKSAKHEGKLRKADDNYLWRKETRLI